MKHPGGRPSKYNKDILEATKEYLLNFKKYGDEIPSIAGLAYYLNISRSTINDWRSQADKKEFSDILENILSQQERVLLNNGLNGTFNANITKLALGKHGYTDKADVTTDGNPITVSFDNAFTPLTKDNSGK